MLSLTKHDVYWCLRRLPRPVLRLMHKQGEKLVLAGGFIRSCISSEKINDVDLFTTSKEAAEIFARELAGETYVFRTDNAFSIRLPGTLVQLIHRWTFETPELVVPSFDFTIARAAIWYSLEKKRWESVCDPRFYADLAGKRLVYCSPVRNEDAGGSLLRVLKFYQRGYRIPLDSMGAVLARLVKDVDFDLMKNCPDKEKQLAKVLTGLLKEVDPNTLDNLAYFPNLKEAA